MTIAREILDLTQQGVIVYFLLLNSVVALLLILAMRELWNHWHIADDEQLARALIEGELGSKAGIRAAHDAGKRILRLRACDASGRVVLVGRRVGGVAGIALLKALERLIGADGVRRRRGRLRPGRQRRKRGAGGRDEPGGQQAAARNARQIALLAHGMYRLLAAKTCSPLARRTEAQ